MVSADIQRAGPGSEQHEDVPAAVGAVRATDEQVRDAVVVEIGDVERATDRVVRPAPEQREVGIREWERTIGREAVAIVVGRRGAVFARRR